MGELTRWRGTLGAEDHHGVGDGRGEVQEAIDRLRGEARGLARRRGHLHRGRRRGFRVGGHGGDRLAVRYVHLGHGSARSWKVQESL